MEAQHIDDEPDHIAVSQETTKTETQSPHNADTQENHRGDENNADANMVYPPLFVRCVIVLSLMLATFLVLHAPNLEPLQQLTLSLSNRLLLTWYVYITVRIEATSDPGSRALSVPPSLGLRLSSIAWPMQAGTAGKSPTIFSMHSRPRKAWEKIT
jgi:hypothetical protein